MLELQVRRSDIFVILFHIVNYEIIDIGAMVVQKVEETFNNRRVASSIPTPPDQVSKCP